MINAIIIAIDSSISSSGGIPADITVDTTLYTADSTLITTDNG